MAHKCNAVNVVIFKHSF